MCRKGYLLMDPGAFYYRIAPLILLPNIQYVLTHLQIYVMYSVWWEVGAGRSYRVVLRPLDTL
jgi:hypothetical protein